MSAGVAPKKRTAVSVDLNLMDYGRALTLQTETVQTKIANPNHPDTLLLVEHPSVFTLGKRGGLENLVVSEQFLRQKKVRVVQTDRGGNITYHGPGQAVFYPIVDLDSSKIAVKDFVFGLEEIMKRTAQNLGVHADRDERNHGLWVKNAKIGSVGISIKKGISFHGLAMNIFPDLTPFSWINPCGLADVAMTSIQKEKNDNSVDPEIMKLVYALFLRHFCDIFDFEIRENKTHENPI